MDLKIVNGTVVTACDFYHAEIGIDKGKIVAIAEKIAEDAREVVDATGAYVFPGGIDVHTHPETPFMGTFSTDDFETATVAACHGGTTSIVIHSYHPKGETLKESIANWKARARGRAVLDYGIHGLITEPTDQLIAEIPEVVKDGVTSIKTHLAYKDLIIRDGVFWKILRKCKEVGALVLVHAENGDLIDALIEDHVEKGLLALRYHALSHPPETEGEATGRAIRIAQMAAAPVYIAHVTCQEALGKIKEARDAGYPVYGETCPHYLLLSNEKYEEKGFEGAKYIMSPPLRDKSNQAHLWKGLASGHLQVVATDHCPFNFKGQKDLGRDDFRKIPNGVPGIENRVQLIFSEGVDKGRISLNRFVDVISTSPAKLFGLYPAKGAIAIGSDADLVVFDPQEKFEISTSTNHENVDYTPYEGYQGKGAPRVVIAGGEILVKEKKFLGKPGRGKYLRRKIFTGSF